MDIEQFRKAGYAAVDQICDYYASLPSRDLKADVEPGFLLKALPDAAPTTGEAITTITNDFQSLVMPGITHWQHPKFFGYFPAGVTFESILADMYAASVTNPGFNWLCSPSCTELEQVVVDWMVKVFGLDDVFLSSGGIGGGIISNSASESCLTAAIAARERALRRITARQHAHGAPEGPTEVPMAIRKEYTEKFVMYGSTQTHSLGAKAALILGVPFRALPVKREDGYALRGDVLRAAVQEDIKNGLTPFCVVGTVGTTSTGAVDYIAELGAVVREFDTMFMHVDAAWAGVAFALPECRAGLRQPEVSEFADSFCTNMHKWGLVGFDCSLFFVRDRTDLSQALDVTPAYLRTKEADAGQVIDYRNWQLSLGRRFRSIKLWFVMRSHGVEGLQKHLRRGVDQIEQLTRIVSDSPIFEIVAQPQLALLCFRLAPKGRKLSTEQYDALHAELYKKLDLRADMLITQTVLKSSDSAESLWCLRIAAGGVYTRMEDVKEVWTVVESVGQEVLSASAP